MHAGLCVMTDQSIAKLFQDLFKGLNVFLLKGPPDTTGKIDQAAYHDVVCTYLVLFFLLFCIFCTYLVIFLLI